MTAKRISFKNFVSALVFEIVFGDQGKPALAIEELDPSVETFRMSSSDSRRYLAPRSSR